MRAKIKKDSTEHGVPYVELEIIPDEDSWENYWITFRRYPRRVFVGVEEYSENEPAPVDLLDCYTAPTYIIEKTLVEDFSPYNALKNAFRFMGKIGRYQDPDDAVLEQLDSEIFDDEYLTIKEKIEEWEKA